MSKSLNKFGDTSFRMKNQIGFYYQILTYIFENENQSKEEIYNHVVQLGIINYTEIKLKKSRPGFLIKQLKFFELIEIKNDNKVSCTLLGKEFIEQTLKYKKIFEQKNIDIIAVFFCFIMIKNGPLSNIFYNFLKFLFTNNTNEITDEILYSFIYIDEQSENFSIQEITSKNISNEEFEKILLNGNMQYTLHFRKPLSIDKSLPLLINSKENYKEVLNNNKKLLDAMKLIYKNYKNINKNIRVSDSDLYNYVETRGGINLINDACLKIKNGTIKKDYHDINKRWFFGIKLFMKIDSKIILNNNYIDIYKFILENKQNINFEKIIQYILKIDDKDSCSQYPYQLSEVIDMLKMIENDGWVHLKKKYMLENIANPTIYEYLVNLAFSLSYNNDIKEFKKWSNTLLDDENKPISHAPGRNPDGIIIEEGGYCGIIESTTLIGVEEIIKNEKYSTQRHAVKTYNEIIKEISSNQKDPLIVFVLNKKYNESIIFNFLSSNNAQYFDNQNIVIKTIVVCCEDIIKLLENNKLNILIKSLYEKIPFECKPNEYFNSYINLLSTIK